MGAISGLHGSITYVSGYTVLARGWAMAIDAADQDGTGLSPAGDHAQMMSVNLLRGAAGAYSCRLAVPHTADMGHDGYDPCPEAWTLLNACEAREITELGAVWRSYKAGLKRTFATFTSYLDDTLALPLAGDTGTANLLVATGIGYTMPYVISGVDTGVDTDDVDRRAVLRATGVSAPTPLGGMPVAGTEGQAIFNADGGRQYTAAILVTSVGVRVNRRLSEGSIDIGFVVNGILGGA